MESRNRSLATCCLLAIGLVAPDSSGQEAAFGESASVVVVEIPVRVLERGRPVHSLTAPDFVVFDQGRKREIVGFQVINRAGAELDLPTDDSAAALGPPRSFLLLFDLAYAGSDHLGRALEASLRLVDERLGPQDQVAVGFFSALRGLRLVADFTADGQRIRGALDIMAALLARNPSLAGEFFDRLQPSADSADSPLVTREDLVAEAGILVRMDPFWPHRSVIRSLARGLAQVPSWVPSEQQGAPGQKHIVYFSYGPPSGYLTGRGSVGTLNELERVFKSLRQSGWSIQAINVAGYRVGMGNESLFLLAFETGGESYENFLDPSEALNRMLVRTSVTYVLAIQPDELKADGGFHRLRVKLAQARPGVRLVHRRGYYAVGTAVSSQLDTPRDRR